MEQIFDIKLEYGAEKPLYKQLAEKIEILIEQGTLKAEQKLPPIRKTADKLNVNASTVVMAYKYLESKKLVYSRVGSGTFVCPPIGKKIFFRPTETDTLSEKEKYGSDIINFISTALPEELFPFEEFKIAFNSVLENEKGRAFSQHNPLGYEPLRESVTDMLKYYSINAKPENVLIVSGARHGLDIVAKSLLRYGDNVIVEKPTFYGAVAAFDSRGANIIEVNLEKDGIDVEEVEKIAKIYRPKLLYMMANFQTPTGISYSQSKKRKLIELADKYDFYIVEDDNLYDFYYGQQEAMSLKSIDYKNRVIYIKSFSKILMPGLKIGCAVFPKKIMGEIEEMGYFYNVPTAGIIQRAVDAYLRNNRWKSHIQVLRKYMESKYLTAIQAADKYLKDDFLFTDPKGGISLYLQSKKELNKNALLQKLYQNSVVAQCVDSEDDKNIKIRLCFCSVSEDDIRKGIMILGQTAKTIY